MKNLFLISLFLVSSFSFGAEPIQSCRVKSEVLKKTAYLVNNAGCVITRKNKNEIEALMTFVNEPKHNEYGWGFPGGLTASSSIEKKLIPKVANSVPFKYSEPAACTAGREAYEEVGFKLIVGDLVAITPHFIAFLCHPIDSKKLHIEKHKPIHVSEIKKLEWISLKKIAENKGSFLRFKNNADIAKKALAMIYPEKR